MLHEFSSIIFIVYNAYVSHHWYLLYVSNYSDSIGLLLLLPCGYAHSVCIYPVTQSGVTTDISDDRVFINSTIINQALVDIVVHQKPEIYVVGLTNHEEIGSLIHPPFTRRGWLFFRADNFMYKVLHVVNMLGCL